MHRIRNVFLSVRADAYHTNYTADEFYDIMEQLARECANGSDDIPQDQEKSNY